MKVSVVITTLNRSRELKRCLESIAMQTEHPEEIVVVDNNSTEDIKKVAESFSAKLPIVYLFEERRGYVFPRNAGIKKVKREIIAFIDNDCVAEKNWLKETKKSFSDPECFLVGGRVEALKTNAPTTVQNYLDKKNNLAISSNFYSMKKGSFANMAARRETFDKIGLVDEQLTTNEDTDFFWRVQQNGLKACLNEKAVVFHENRKTVLGFAEQIFGYGKGSVLLAEKHKITNPPYFKQTKLPSVLKNMFHGISVSLLGMLANDASKTKLFFGLEKTIFWSGVLWEKTRLFFRAKRIQPLEMQENKKIP